ncbi:MAG: type II secretion system F family protein [Rubritepida sp.]|nr:type II secretion system F family protein [Rubritepida sp.]
MTDAALPPALLAALFAGCAALLLAAGAALLALSRQEARAAARLAALRVPEARPGPPRRGEAAWSGAARALASLGHWMARSGLLSPRTFGELERTVAAAGLRGGNAVAAFVGAKVVGLPAGGALGAAIALAAGLEGATAFAVFAVFAVLGLLLPDWMARRFRKRHLAALERGLPDALDLLVVCAEAGLSLEAAVARVAEEIRFANRSVGEELALTAQELALLSDRRQALLNLGERTGLDSLRRVAGAALRHAHHPGAAHPGGGAARGAGQPLRGACRTAALDADGADDPLHPADALPRRGRDGAAARAGAALRGRR